MTRRMAIVGTLWAVAVLTTMGGTVYFLRDAVNNAYFLRVHSATQSARQDLQEFLDRHTRDIDDMADALSESSGNDEPTFQTQALRFLRGASLFSSVGYVDDRLQRQWVFPFPRGRRGLGQTPTDEARRAAQKAQRTRSPAVSGIMEEGPRARTLWVYAPLHPTPLWGGLLEGPLEVATLVRDLFEPALGERFRLTVIDEDQGRELFTTLDAPRPPGTENYDSFFTLRVADRTWWVLLHPPEPPPTFFIVAGALLTEAVIGVLTFYLWSRRP